MPARERWVKAAGLLLSCLAVAACGADDGGGGAAASVYPSINWPGIHRDARNSDFGPAPGARDLTPAFHVLQGLSIAAVPSLGPTGNLYVTTNNPTGCHLYALDPFSGAQRWCSSEVNGLAITSSALSDVDGNLYIGDGEAMYSFTAAGALRWRTPLRGFAISSQFTPDGRLIFITHIGAIYVLERDSGAAALPPLELVAGANPQPGDSADCFVGGAGSRCYSANTLAIDPDSGRFFFTLSRPDAADTAIVAMRYRGGATPSIEALWENETLNGGSAASPTLSIDGTRIYGNDLDGNLFAIDALSGEVVWLYGLDASPLGSVSLRPDGVLIPTGPGTLVAVRDAGDHGELVFERRDVQVSGLAVQAEGDLAYIVGRSPGQPVSLLVVDTNSGETLDSEPLEGNFDLSIGTTIASDGHVYVTGLRTGIWGFAPAVP